MRKLTVEVPDELIDLAGGSDDCAVALMLQTAVMELVRRHAMSAGKAAEFLKISRWELPKLFSLYEVPATELRPEDVQPF